MTLVPFTPDTMPDVLLPQLYATCKRDRILRYIFTENPNISFAQFISQLCGKVILLGVSAGEEKKVLGFGWLWDIKGNKDSKVANIGFACFKEGWASKKEPTRGDDIRAIARLALGWWFCEAGIDVVYGTTLATNKIAQRFALQVGFSRLTTLPKFLVRDGKLVDAVLFCVERDRFIGGM